MYYDIAVVDAINRIWALKWLLQKVVQQAQSKGMSGSVLLGLALADDMFPLLKQFQVITDNAKGAIGRLTDKEAPVFDDSEATLDELYARLDKTVEFLKTIKPEDFDWADDKRVEMKYFEGKHFTGKGYFVTFYLPNINFHAGMVYSICRAHGFNIGKNDYLGNLALIDNA